MYGLIINQLNPTIIHICNKFVRFSLHGVYWDIIGFDYYVSFWDFCN